MSCGILGGVGRDRSTRAGSQRRGQPKNKGQFASGPSKQAAAADIHPVDLNTRSNDRNISNQTWTAMRLTDGERPGSTWADFLADEVATLGEALQAVANDISTLAKEDIAVADLDALAINFSDLGMEQPSNSERWYAHPAAQMSTWSISPGSGAD